MRQKNINGVDQKLRKFFETEFNEKSAFWIDRLSTAFDERSWVHLSKIKEIRDEALAFSDIANTARMLTRQLSDLNEEATEFALRKDGFDVAGLEKLLRDLEVNAVQWSGDLNRGLKSVDVRGGRNLAAYAVAEMIAYAFKKEGEKISFGQDYEGNPSTRFCRVVAFALSHQKIAAHWRRPAEFAFRRGGEDWRSEVVLVFRTDLRLG